MERGGAWGVGVARCKIIFPGATVGLANRILS